MGDQALQGLTAQVSTNNGWRLVKEQVGQRNTLIDVVNCSYLCNLCCLG